MPREEHRLRACFVRTRPFQFSLTGVVIVMHVIMHAHKSCVRCVNHALQSRERPAVANRHTRCYLIRCLIQYMYHLLNNESVQPPAVRSGQIPRPNWARKLRQMQYGQVSRRDREGVLQDLPLGKVPGPNRAIELRHVPRRQNIKLSIYGLQLVQHWQCREKWVLQW